MSESSLSRRGSIESLSSLVSSSTLNSEPDILLPPLTGPLVWQGDELNPESYVLELTGQDVHAVEEAIASFKFSGRPLSTIASTSFPLPSHLVNKLAVLRRQIHAGIGVAVLRGLGDCQFSDEESVIAFTGIASHICPERATDAYANQTLSHIRDATHDKVPKWAKNIGLAGSKLPVAMEFHADRFSGDVLALNVRNSGGEHNGGDQYLASFWSIYNELLHVAPDVLETLAFPNWPFELKDPASGEPYLEYGPVIFYSEGRVISQLVRAPLIGSPKIPRSENMPKLSPEQIHALRIVEETAQQLSVKLDRMDGDIQFINNLGILHSRSAYKGTRPKGASSRHLLRMFLRDSAMAWPKPTGYAHKFNDPFTPGRLQNIPIVDDDPWRKISGHQSHG